jgi:hypothetical protein
MKLTPPPSPATVQAKRFAQTTAPGFINRNSQEVVASTGRPSSSFRGQTVYKLKCRKCAGGYGANGCDIHLRRCPFCQNGEAGEPIPEKAATLFDGLSC